MEKLFCSVQTDIAIAELWPMGGLFYSGPFAFDEACSSNGFLFTSQVMYLQTRGCNRFLLSSGISLLQATAQS